MSFTKKVFLPGTRIRHKRFGWEGAISRFGHEDGRLAVIWTKVHGETVRGASLAEANDLIEA